MVAVRRFPGNPLLSPNPKHAWESKAVFNGCPIVASDGIHMLYRAMGPPQTIKGQSLELSTIGHALSFDRVHFVDRRKFIFPEHDWERFGCEDPRITKIDDTYYIFYTGLASWPPAPAGITIALATTRDFRKIDQKYHITPFNGKAMTLFPKKINGKLTALLTVDTDIPPSKIAIARFDDISDMWNPAYWKDWHKTFQKNTIPLLRSHADHIEIGAPPIETADGWLLIYCYIYNYLSSTKIFAIEAVLLDLNDPQKLIGHTKSPLLFPEHQYELVGQIPNVIFPSGALVFNDNLGIYYGGADSTVCLATCSLKELLTELKSA